MKLSKISLAGYFVLVFLGGGVVGALSQRLYTAATVNAKVHRSPDEYRKRYLEEMRTRLQLDETQIHALNGILDETREKYNAARKKMDPEMKAIKSEQVSRINAILKEDQRREYQKMRDEREKKSQQPRSGAPGGC